MTTTVIFVDLGGDRTDIRIHQSGVPKMFRTPQARSGFTTSLDRLTAYVATQ